MKRLRAGRRFLWTPRQQLGIVFVLLCLIGGFVFSWFPSPAGEVSKPLIPKQTKPIAPVSAVTIPRAIPKTLAPSIHVKIASAESKLRKPHLVATSGGKKQDVALLRSLFQKYGYTGPKSNSAVDYMNPVYDEEAAELRAGLDPNSPSLSASELSLLLISRSGHRHRVVDLIGGKHELPAVHKFRIPQEAHIFSASPHDISPQSPRDFRRQPIYSKAECMDSPKLPKCSLVQSSQGIEGDAYLQTMENLPCNPGMAAPFNLCANTELTSDTPLPYVSWHDFGILEPVVNVSLKTGLAAAYISNCGFYKRNQMVRDLIQHTDGRVQSYGQCEKFGNVSEPVFPGLSRDNQKIRVLQTFKFSLAFENSETPDYITEKFFGSLCAGSVPVVIGAPNAAFFAPDTGPYPYESWAMIHTQDFDFNPASVAALMLDLNRHDQAYARMLSWKSTGYSDDYKALVDLTDVHSDCRMCIAYGDDLRRKGGINKFDLDGLTRVVNPALDRFSVFVRERGEYLFVQLGFPGPLKTLKQLIDRILVSVTPRTKNLWLNNDDKRQFSRVTRVYALYLPRPVRLPILSNQDVSLLPNGCEIEVIFV